MSAPDVLVVGGGIVGACAALELARGGATVEVLERGGGWGEGCSWGNAGLLVPSHARPIAAPESLKAGIGWMVRPDSPFGLKLKPSLAPWLARYLRASTAARAAAGEAFVNESVIGTRFTGRVAEETTVGGLPAIVPEITGRAWVTGMGQYLLDASDPFPAGFAL